LRGGSFNYSADNVRVSERIYYAGDALNNNSNTAWSAGGRGVRSISYQ